MAKKNPSSLLDQLHNQELIDIAEVESWSSQPEIVEVDAKKWKDVVGSQGDNKPEVELVLVNGKHFYQVADETCPYYVSVTTILSALAKGKGFDIWLSKNTQEEQQDILAETSLRGSKVHRAAEILVSGKQIIPEEFEYKDGNEIIHRGLTTEEKNMINTFVRWWYEFKPKLYASEKIVYNTTYKYAGTLDLIVTIKEGLLDKKSSTPDKEVFVIADLKTSSGIYPSYEMQLAAYAAAEHQMSGRKIDKGAILRLGTKHKTGYEFKIIDSLAESYKAFLGVLAAWKYQNPDFAPKFMELPKQFSLPPIQQVAITKQEEESVPKTNSQGQPKRSDENDRGGRNSDSESQGAAQAAGGDAEEVQGEGLAFPPSLLKK